MFTAILKKECKQHVALWIALFLFVVVLQLIAAIMYALSNQMGHPSFIGIAVVISLLYAAGSAAIVFCNEHEEKTYTFLRSLPIPRGTLLAGKLAWVVLSSLAFALGTVLESLPWEAGFDNVSVRNDEVVLLLLACTVGVLYSICFGLFWSTWFKSQLHSLLATFISGSVAFPIVAVAAETIAKNYPTLIPEQKIVFFPCISILTLLVGAVAVRNAYYWISAQEPGASAPGWLESQKNVFVTTTYPGADAPGSCACVRCGEFRTLFVHAVRQSAGQCWAAIVVGAIAFVTILLAINIEETHRQGWIVLVVLLGVVTVFVLCGSVFSGDQKTRGAFFAERGLSPRKIWWSRILAFGSVYFGIGLVLGLVPAYHFLYHECLLGKPQIVIATILLSASLPIGCYVSVFCI
jgi:hypothetical protein